MVHFSTHAVADTRDPDRSRILLAPRSPGGPADYLFLRDVDDLDLTGVGLVTLSACETARGKVVRGEGVEGFSRALLAAGAAAAVTTLWDVADRPSAELMTQFYASASGGRGTAEALRRGQAEVPALAARVDAPVLLGRLHVDRERTRGAAARRAVERDRRVGGRLAARVQRRASSGSEGDTVQDSSSQSRPITSIGADALTATDEPDGGVTPSRSSDSSIARRCWRASVREDRYSRAPPASYSAIPTATSPGVGFWSASPAYWLSLDNGNGPSVAAVRGVTEKMGSVAASSARELTVVVVPRM